MSYRAVTLDFAQQSVWLTIERWRGLLLYAVPYAELRGQTARSG
jgi:hypothetical protein